MSNDLVHATLAAAIIVARQATSVQQIQAAWLDAEHIARPRPTDPVYKAWQEANGIQATTPEQDAERVRVRATGIASRAQRYAR